MPRFAFFLVLFTLSSIGLPGMNGFVGEFLILIGIPAPLAITQAAGGVGVTVAGDRGAGRVGGRAGGLVYALARAARAVRAAALSGRSRDRLGRRAFNDHSPAIRDLSFRESLLLTPLAVLVFWIGLSPQLFMRPFETGDPKFNEAKRENRNRVPA